MTDPTRTDREGWLWALLSTGVLALGIVTDVMDAPDALNVLALICAPIALLWMFSKWRGWL